MITRQQVKAVMQRWECAGLVPLAGCKYTFVMKGAKNMDMNEVHLTGRLVKDVELKTTGTGNPFVWFSLAVNGAKDKSGKTAVDYLTCQLWGKPAELLAKFGQKGKRILISRGCLKTFAKVDTATGEKRSYTYVLIQSFEFLDSLKQRSESSFFDSMGDEVDF